MSCYLIFSGDFDVQIRNGYQPNVEVFLHLFSCGRFDHWSVLSSTIFGILHTGILALQQVELLIENGAFFTPTEAQGGAMSCVHACVRP